MRKFIGISLLIILFDRLTKIIVSNFIFSRVYLIKGFFYLTNARNEGAAFSILEGKQILFVLIGLVTIGMLYLYMLKSNSNNIGYPLLFGGIIGNIIDRIVFGYVIDFIGFEIFNISMPIFNIADIAIVIGALLVIIGSEKNEVSSRNRG